MKINEEDKKIIRELINHYFLVNPNNNKGIAFRTKAWDIISSYYIKHNMSKEEIKHCIDSNPMCRIPIWDQFYKYWFESGKKNRKDEKDNIEESGKYKKSVDQSLDPSDWV